jgi:hypothetical protein
LSPQCGEVRNRSEADLNPFGTLMKSWGTLSSVQSYEIAVAGDQAEAIKLPRVQQIHGVDDERAVF